MKVFSRPTLVLRLNRAQTEILSKDTEEKLIAAKNNPDVYDLLKDSYLSVIAEDQVVGFVMNENADGLEMHGINVQSPAIVDVAVRAVLRANPRPVPIYVVMHLTIGEIPALLPSYFRPVQSAQTEQLIDGLPVFRVVLVADPSLMQLSSVPSDDTEEEDEDEEELSPVPSTPAPTPAPEAPQRKEQIIAAALNKRVLGQNAPMGVKQSITFERG